MQERGGGSYKMEICGPKTFCAPPQDPYPLQRLGGGLKELCVPPSL